MSVPLPCPVVDAQRCPGLPCFFFFPDTDGVGRMKLKI